MIRQLFLLAVAIAALAIVGSYILFRRMMPLRTKSVVLEMSWKRGDNHYGPNSISLESPCLGNSQPGCFCSVGFRVTTSKDFAGYISSFGNSKVPVKYAVDYDRNRQVVGAGLESVGTWPKDRFHMNELSLGTGFRAVVGKEKISLHSRDPGDCFPNAAH
jgi:hypothetical protein